MKPRINNNGIFTEFDTEAELSAYIESIFALQPPSVDYKQVVQEKIDLGKKIMLEYLADNAEINLTYEQSILQLQKFQVVKAFLEVGNLDDSKLMIENISTDDIFTQERKDKYLAMF